MSDLLAPITSGKSMVNKEYADLAAQRAVWDPVEAASTVNHALAGNGALPVVDGVQTGYGTRVALVAQDDPAENGIYEVIGDGTVWAFARAGDADDTELFFPGKGVFVLPGGQVNGKAWLVQTSPVPGNFSADAIIFEAHEAGTTNGMEVHTFTTDGTTANFVIAHGFGSTDIMVEAHSTGSEATVAHFGRAFPDDSTVILTGRGSDGLPLPAGQTFKALVFGRGAGPGPAAPAPHASTHDPEGTDPIPAASTTEYGLVMLSTDQEVLDAITIS